MQAAVPAQPVTTENHPTLLILRNDTMLGICAGLGQEFGFNPNILRVLIASLFLVSFKAAIGIYLALGLALAIGQLLFRSPRDVRATAQQPALEANPEANDAHPVPETLAA